MNKTKVNINHLEKSKYFGPSGNVMNAVNLINKYERRVLDLGCGSLRNSKFLYNCGFIVDAIDKDPEVKKYCQFFDNRPKGIFNLKIGDYLRIDIEEEKYDIVVAENTLSFNTDVQIRKMVAKVFKALKSGGFFAGNFYGPNDYRNPNNNMAFYSTDQVKVVLNLFKVEYINETTGYVNEEEKTLQWHSFEFVAQKSI